jgi:hypothetical protein
MSQEKTFSFSRERQGEGHLSKEYGLIRTSD